MSLCIASQFYQAHGREPSNAELASAAEMPEAKLELLLKSDRSPISLDKPKDREGSGGDVRSWLETIPDSKLPPEEYCQVGQYQQVHFSPHAQSVSYKR